MYADALWRAGVGIGQPGSFGRWLREGGPNNNAMADLIALSMCAIWRTLDLVHLKQIMLAVPLGAQGCCARTQFGANEAFGVQEVC